MDTKELVKERGGQYGSPSQDFLRTARFWTTYLKERTGLDILITQKDVPMMMILLKMSREMHKHKKDSCDDIGGYAETINMLYEE